MKIDFAKTRFLGELELLILTCDCKHMTRIPGTAVETFDNIFLLASVSCSIN